MRFRSVGVSASNMDEYLSKFKAQEAEYMEESTLSQLNFFSLEQKNNQDNQDDDSDDYALLGHKSNYKITKIKTRKKRRKRGRIFSTQFFRKKIYFHHHKRRSLNSEQIDKNINKNGKN